MARALERRNETWRVLHDYVLDERERFGLIGPSDLRLFGSDRQYTWYVQDGVLVRSPVRVNGVSVPDADRREYEARWLDEERSRAERLQKKAAEKKDAPSDDAGVIAGKGLEPRFVSEAYFLRFRFERGRYFLVGREQLDGRPVLKVEYYPKKLFVHTDDADHKHKEHAAKEDAPQDGAAKDAARRNSKQDKGEQMEEQFERKFNKVSMVTLWIDPVESQIVRYDFENLGLDFLPGQWLVRVGETSASMTMGRYFDGVWLPKAIVMKGDLQAAIGTFDIDYRREFLEYRKAETSARIRGYGDVK